MIDVRPKKRFGQNFLHDSSVVERILTAAAVDAGARVLEIGPGLGALTERLLEQGAEMTVMEVDRELAARLVERGEPKLTVHQGDALRLDWPTLLSAPPYRLVANLPYNISSQILFKILDHHRLFSRLVLMFQKEVGDRLCASPGGRDYGILSVFCQLWFDVKRVTVVHPGAFFPPPKVQSVVLCFDPLAAPRVPVAAEPFFRRVVKGSFSQRRKTLRNALVGSGFAAGLDEALSAADIDPGRRGETLSLAEFARLSDCLAAVSQNSCPRETSC
jgi:16S rRNA (adenine1518-N6/adenine1519-N6)-dimethyltransferase